MRIDGERESNNVEDRRDSGGSRMGGGKGMGVGTIVVALAASYFFNINPMTTISIMNGISSNSEPTSQNQLNNNANTNTANDPLKQFVRVVMAQTEDTWTTVFQEQGKTYSPPKLVMFSGRTSTDCGLGETATGPFYCPADQKIYIDPQFYTVLEQRLGAPGDFARAYVIGHEVGHHVQNVLGVMNKVEAAKRQNPKQANPLSVRLELQADCFAGIWAKRTQASRNILEAGDLEEAIQAASSVGDDALQGALARPETFTHGTSSQRMQWFKRGFEGGNMSNCNTFSNT
jgi:predicted metalloprotease